MLKAFSRTSIRARLRAELPLKLFLLLALNAAIWIPYQALQRIHFFPATVMPQSFIDKAIPFSPAAVWPYLSVYLFLPIGPFLFVERKRIMEYSRGVLAMGFVSTVIFVFWPTICPRPEAIATNAAYRALIAFDNPYHAFPSLHAAFAIYSALCLTDVARELSWPAIVKFAIWFWAGAILCATLATRQHVATDIFAGGLLGAAAHHFFLACPQSIRKLQKLQLAHEN